MKRLFVAFTKLNAKPLRIGQYYMNKAAFDKKADVSGIHEYMESNGIAHTYRVFEGRENKLGHVFNILHPEWEESVEANEFILDFFKKKAN